MTTIQAEESTAEGRIFNEVVALLERQREEPVAPSLKELHSQLLAIYEGKSKNFDVATCQMGLALIAFGLGKHDEARRQLCNAQKNDGYAEHIASNALILLRNIGDLEAAHSAALEAVKRFPGNPTILRGASMMLKDTLDFGASADSLDQLLKVVSDDARRQSYAVQRDQMRGLEARAGKLGFDAKSLRERAFCAAGALHAAKKKIFWVQLRGTTVNSVSLEFYVNANAEACAELNFAMADALIERFDDTAMDVVTMSARSYGGWLAVAPVELHA